MSAAATRKPKAARPWAQPLVPLYRAGLWLERQMRSRGVSATRELAWPVVSVGSLSAGGAGKTPVVIALAQMLRAANWHVDVLTRGYGRSDNSVARVSDVELSTAALVNADGEALTKLFAPTGADTTETPERKKYRRLLVDPQADRYGDEPMLIAARTGAPVWVGGARFDAGTAAEKAVHDAEFDPSASLHRQVVSRRCLHLLDDGFQHRELARAFDIVLVTAADLDDALLPAGTLREPLAAIRRADAVVVRSDEIAAMKPRLWPLLRQGAQVWTVERRLRFPTPLGVLTAGLRPLAVCAIARPEGFAAALAEAGCGVVDTVVFRDHQQLHARQLSEIVAFAKQLKASGLVITEKDFVKMSHAALAMLWREVGPVCVAALDAVFADQAPIVAAIESKLAGGRNA